MEVRRMRRKGFTLAEVLITLGIIGVVATLTMPGLVANYQKKVQLVHLKKTYNRMAEAIRLYEVDTGIFSDLYAAGMTEQAKADEFMETYFNTVKKCPGTVTGCFATNYNFITGANYPASNMVSTTSYILADGTAVRFYVSVNPGTGGRIGVLAIDTSSLKGPNVLGRDLFFITLYKNGLMDDVPPSGSVGIIPPLTSAQREAMWSANNCKTKCGDYGWFGKILNDGWEMNY
jgi:prepilin-type N-terminal cleavage/methylation domain-containing protein